MAVSSEVSPCGLGLVGFGTVGTGVWNIIERNGGLISSRTAGDVTFEIRRICVRDLDKPRDANAPSGIFTTDWQKVVEDPSVDVVVELIGGTTLAFDLVAAALHAEKPVVTGNKALLAERGAELFALSAETGTPIFFEAAVAGAIPVIKAVRESLIGNKIEAITGIINGTCNYILQRMTEAGLAYPEALQEAKELGYAEADETLDVNGWDAAHKAILLGSLSHGFLVDPQEVYVRGIEKIRPIDIHFAKTLGYVVKLISMVKTTASGALEIRTQPSFIPKSHILASVNGVFNAVAIKGDAAGESLYYGRGAGQEPTASSVLSDLVDAAQALNHPEIKSRAFQPYLESGEVLPIGESETSYYVRFKVSDETGVLARVATILADHGIGLSGCHSPIDPDNPDADFNDIVFLLHTCPFQQLREALTEVEKLPTVQDRPVVFRLEKL